VIDGRMVKRQEDKEETIRSYWMILRKNEDTGN
jgi:hypothetical protein